MTAFKASTLTSTTRSYSPDRFAMETSYAGTSET